MSKTRNGDLTEGDPRVEPDKDLIEVKAGVPARIVDRPASPPEVLTPEAAEAVKGFTEALYGAELGELDVEALARALVKAQEEGGTVNLNDGYTASRLVDEAKHLLCWRPPKDPDEPSMWITHPDVAAAKGDMPTLPRAAVAGLERAVGRMLSRSVPRSQELERVQDVIGFTRDNGVDVDWSNEETVKVFSDALFNHKYHGDTLDFIRMIESIRMPVSDNTKTFVIEKELTNVFSGFSFGSDSIRNAETVVAFAKDRNLELKLNGNEYLGHHLFRRLEDMFKQSALDIAQDMLDFCKRHEISVPDDVKVRLGRELSKLAHNGRSNLRLDHVEEVLEFAQRNDIDPDLPEEMLARWRTQIPDLVQRRKDRSRWGRY